MTKLITFALCQRFAIFYPRCITEHCLSHTSSPSTYCRKSHAQEQRAISQIYSNISAAGVTRTHGRCMINWCKGFETYSVMSCTKGKTGGTQCFACRGTRGCRWSPDQQRSRRRQKAWNRITDNTCSSCGIISLIFFTLANGITLTEGWCRFYLEKVSETEKVLCSFSCLTFTHFFSTHIWPDELTTWAETFYLWKKCHPCNNSWNWGINKVISGDL